MRIWRTRAGQIELYTHFNIMRRIKDLLVRLDYAVCAVYLIDAQFAEVRAGTRVTQARRPVRSRTQASVALPPALLCSGPRQVFLRDAHGLVDHDPTRAAACQRALENGPVSARPARCCQPVRRARGARCSLLPSASLTAAEGGGRLHQCVRCGRYLNADTGLLLADVNKATSPRYQALNQALAGSSTLGVRL